MSDTHCITCSDSASVCTVRSVDVAHALADVAFADGSNGPATATVDVCTLDAVRIGDTLLVHAGTALSLLHAAHEEHEESTSEKHASEESEGQPHETY